MIRLFLIVCALMITCGTSIFAQNKISASEASSFINVLDFYEEEQTKGAEVKSATLTYVMSRRNGQERRKEVTLNGAQLDKRTQAMIANLDKGATLTISNVVVIVNGQERRLKDIIVTR